MPGSTVTLAFERHIAAPPAHVYDAFTNATALREWVADIATTSPKVGGYLFLAWHDGHFVSGRFTKLQPHEHVAFSWQDGLDGNVSLVSVDIRPASGDSVVAISHSDVDPDHAASYEKEWQASLDNLVSVLTDGPDLRITRRPMLGIMLGELNDEIAARMDLPSAEGIRLEDVIAGMGAASAGLQTDDVVVAIDDIATHDWGALNHALSRHHAGDTVTVTYYRDGRQQTTAMELGGRHIPDIPPTAAGLADAVEAQLNAAYRQYVDALGSVPADVAARRPSPDEWSVNEILAHLIHSVRGTGRWVSDLIGGQEAHYDDWGGNVVAALEATVTAYGSLQGLMDELDRSQREVVALVRRLPDDFVARHGRYWRLAWSLLDGAYHLDAHLDQVKAAVTPLPTP